MSNNGIGHKFQQKKVKSRISAEGYLDAREGHAFNSGIAYAYEILDARYPELDIRSKVETMLSEMREQQIEERAQEGAKPPELSGVVLPNG